MDIWPNNPELKCALRFEIPIDFQKLLNRIDILEKNVTHLQEAVFKKTKEVNLMHANKQIRVDNDLSATNNPLQCNSKVANACNNAKLPRPQQIKEEIIDISNDFCWNFEGEKEEIASF